MELLLIKIFKGKYINFIFRILENLFVQNILFVFQKTINNLKIVKEWCKNTLNSGGIRIF